LNAKYTNFARTAMRKKDNNKCNTYQTNCKGSNEKKCVSKDNDRAFIVK
jgi:hypothetical protein